MGRKREASVKQNGLADGHDLVEGLEEGGNIEKEFKPAKRNSTTEE